MTWAHHRTDEAQLARAARGRLVRIPFFQRFTIGAHRCLGKRLRRQVAPCRVENVSPEDDGGVPPTRELRNARWRRPARWLLRTGVRREQLRRQNAGRPLRQEESAQSQRCEANRSRDPSFARSCHRWLLEQRPCRIGATKTVVISGLRDEFTRARVDNVTGLIPPN